MFQCFMYDMLTLFAVQISVVRNKVFLEHRHGYSFMCCIWLLLRFGILAAENMWLTKPKIFNIWSIIEKVCLSLISEK